MELKETEIYLIQKGLELLAEKIKEDAAASGNAEIFDNILNDCEKLSDKISGL